MTNYYNQVKCILEIYPESRDDDMILYATFLHLRNVVNPSETFFDVMLHAKERKLPSYGGVTRARRKVQADEPSLRGNNYRGRQHEEEQYHDYYSKN